MVFEITKGVINMSPFMGELIGTLVLILLGNGVVAGTLLKKSKAQNSGWVAITLGWGLAVTFAIYIVDNISGAHLNPAVTIAFACIGLFPWSEVPSYIGAQLMGAFLGSIFVWLQYFPHWKETKNQEIILSVFSTSPAITSWPSNLLSEIIGTAVFVFSILAMSHNKVTDGLLPIIIGALIVSIGLSLGGTTGFALNPARDFGPRLAHQILPICNKGSSDWGYAWIPIIGSTIGGIIGAICFQLIY